MTALALSQRSSALPVPLAGSLDTYIRSVSQIPLLTPEAEQKLAHELHDARVVLFTRDGLYVDLPAGAPPEAWMLARGYRPLAEATPNDAAIGGLIADTLALRTVRGSRPFLPTG